MPMKYSVGVGPYLHDVNVFLRDSVDLDELESYFTGGVPVETIQDIYAGRAGITPPDSIHFKLDWLGTGGGTYSKTFPYVKNDDIRQVLKAGNLKAIELAKSQGVPIQQAWVVNGSQNQFEVAVILNPGVNIQMLISTPEPRARAAQGNPDTVWIARINDQGVAVAEQVETPPSP